MAENRKCRCNMFKMRIRKKHFHFLTVYAPRVPYVTPIKEGLPRTSENFLHVGRARAFEITIIIKNSSFPSSFS